MKFHANLVLVYAFLGLLGGGIHDVRQTPHHAAYGNGGAVRGKTSRIPKSQIYKIGWRVLGRPGGRTVRIGSIVGWCPDKAGKTRPHIAGVEQTDGSHAVTLTAYVQRVPLQHCLGVDTPVEHVVHIRHGLHGRALYDGSRSPPLRRWPR